MQRLFLAMICGILTLWLVSFFYPQKQFKKLGDQRGLSNLFRIQNGLYSGSQPEGDEAFNHLKSLGVTTIVSVDGALPNIKLAEKFGLQYIHLPIGYDAVPREKIVALAKVLKDRVGNVYVHCHHGKHRGPASAAAALRCLNQMSKDDALRLMTTAGTDPHYSGLYRDAISAAELSEEEKSIKLVLSNQVQPTALIQRMVAIDEIFERYKKTGQQSDQLLLFEEYREINRLKLLPENASSREVSLFRRHLQEALTVDKSGSERESLSRPGKEYLSLLKQSCIRCHEDCRDTK